MMRRVVLGEVLSTCCSRVGLVDADCEYLHGFSVYGNPYYSFLQNHLRERPFGSHPTKFSP